MRFTIVLHVVKLINYLEDLHSTLFILNFRSEEQDGKIERLEMQVEAQGVLLKEIGKGFL